MVAKHTEDLFLEALKALHSQLYKNLVSGRSVAEKRGEVLDKTLLFITTLLAGLDTSQRLGDKQINDLQVLIELSKQVNTLIEANNKQIDQFPMLIKSTKQYRLDIEAGELGKASRQRGGADIEDSMY